MGGVAIGTVVGKAREKPLVAGAGLRDEATDRPKAIVATLARLLWA
jgi:hypothetical protein